ncbi:type II toxin-antitoxin system RelE/ParE family toxin, partial [Shigella boydii]
PEGYRVLYSVEEDIITAHVILSQRQDIKQLLFRRLIRV